MTESKFLNTTVILSTFQRLVKNQVFPKHLCLRAKRATIDSIFDNYLEAQKSKLEPYKGNRSQLGTAGCDEKSCRELKADRQGKPSGDTLAGSESVTYSVGFLDS